MNAFTRAFFKRARLLALAVLILPLIAFTAFGQCGELIVNGDFESGDTGFGTEYLQANEWDPPSIWWPEYYAVVSDPSTVHPCFGGVDHTTGTGMLLAVNGSTTPGTKVWYQTVAVVPNSTYNLSAWVNSHCSTTSRANLSFRVNGVQVGLPFLAPATTFVWSQYSGEWYSGTATSALIEIIDLNTDYDSNDFGIDDISFYKLDEPPVITPVTDLTMWPPNHEYHTYTLAQLVTSVVDDCDPSPEVYIGGIVSDEPENATGDGDGNTYDDMIVAPDCQSIQLRAERQGEGNGRVYSVMIMARDDYGNFSMAYAKIAVNHDPTTPAIDDGFFTGYRVLSECMYTKEGKAVSAPMQFTLEQNYPNPFNPSTEIGYTLGDESYVRLVVYDHLGREVAVLDEGVKSAGAYTATFNAQDLASGVYFYQLQTLDGAKTRKMVLTK